MPPSPAPESLDALSAQRLAALDDLLAALEGALAQASPDRPLADFTWRHLAKAVGTGRSAVQLLRAGAWSDAAILVRALYEQLFVYLWVAREPELAEARREMVSLKQDWANAQYLDRLAAQTEGPERARLEAEAAVCREAAQARLSRLAAELGLSEKQVRDTASLRVSAKAFEVNLEPAFSVPYATYSGFVHSDGMALEAFGGFSPRPPQPARFDLPGDLRRVLERLATETLSRTESDALKDLPC